MRALITAAILFLPLSAKAQSAFIPLQDLFGDVGLSGTVAVESISPKGDRCAISVIVVVPALLSEMDELGRSQGNMGSSRNRLYWVGPTRLRGVEGPNTILLSSRARYESWTYLELVFDTIKNKNFQDTKTVDLRLFADWNRAAKKLKLSYEVQNIHNFPGSLEAALRGLGLQFGGSSTFDLPDTSSTERLEPEITEGPTFEATSDGKGLTISAVVTANLPRNLLVDSCVALRSALAAEPEKLSEFAMNIVKGM